MVCAATLALLCAVSAALAASGDPDPSFDGDGKVILALGANNPGSAVAVQSDGKILVAGGGTANGLAVSRLNTDGSLDTSFGTNGTANFDSGHPATTNALNVGPDGKIVLVGTVQVSGTNSDVAVARANPDGTPDLTFDGTGGARDADLGSNDDLGLAVVEQPDGKVVFAGQGANGQLVVGRLLSGGTFDGSFNPAIRGFIGLTFGLAAHANALALQGDGKIVVAGSFVRTNPTNDNNRDAVVVRLTATARWTRASTAPGRGRSTRVATRTRSPSRSSRTGRRSSPARRTRQRWRSCGWAPTARPTRTSATTESRPSRSTTRSSPPAGSRFSPTARSWSRGPAWAASPLARLQPGGDLDTTLSQDGKQVLDFNPQTLDFGDGVALAPNGAIVVAGSSGSNTTVGRLLGDPAAPGGGGGGGGGGAGGVPRCAGHLATIVGTNGRDKLKGTRRADVIVALGGNDKISGGGGNDIICGGDGNDSITGGSGSDKLYGQDGKDKLSGQRQRQMSGGAGNDKLSGRRRERQALRRRGEGHPLRRFGQGQADRRRRQGQGQRRRRARTAAPRGDCDSSC